MSKNVIHWKNKMDYKLVRQGSYHDESSFKVAFETGPYADPDMPAIRERIRNAISMKTHSGGIVGSSYGSQNYSVQDINFKTMVITVHVSTGIGE